jgi:hypothetical protein
MEVTQSGGSRYAAVYRDTLDFIQLLDKVTERINRPDSLVTDSEASQSLDCLRADLSRISQDLDNLRITASRETGNPGEPSEAWSNSVILGGLALGFFLEKPWGNDFLTAH